MQHHDRLGCRLTPPPHRSGTAVALRSAAAFLLFLLGACQDAVAPSGPPYLAIITSVSRLPGAEVPTRLTYRIRELSGTLGFDQQLAGAASDTLILSVPPASFAVELGGVPPTCSVRDGTLRSMVLTSADNTGLVRYSLQCRALLAVQVIVDGANADPGYLLRVRSAAGAERALGVTGSDTTYFNDLPPDRYEVELGGVAEHCVVTNVDGARQELTLEASGGAVIDFRVRCSAEANRPRIVSFVAGSATSTGVFAVTVTDPNGDIDGYEWNLTDCDGRTVLPDRRPRGRRNVRAGRAALGDTITILGAFEVDLPPDAFRDRCATIRVYDFAGNTSAISSHRLGRPAGTAPTIAGFNSLLIGTSFVQTAMTVVDPDQDVVGYFLAVRLRDGTLNPPDGVADLGVLDPAGFLGTDVPPIPTTGRIQWDDIYAVVVWVLDAGGNAVRVDDLDIFR